ncbi:hypothetical protein [Embleya hyalina]|uniref:Uncharacterized protein n=1 Tax=Embleya hyalina TaxID=516124 RepID=A0A401YUI1_9ACTN|nr:hypothetical protein [Embleya hyalina]GCD98236.1 hypothetical protein EHYA_05939 [Embleya hyalina]
MTEIRPRTDPPPLPVPRLDEQGAGQGLVVNRPFTSFGHVTTPGTSVPGPVLITVSRSLPAVVEAAGAARRLVWEVGDGIGVDGERRGDVGLMVTELVSAALGAAEATSYVLDVTGATDEGRPVLAVVFREVGLTHLPHRRLESGRGLAVVASLTEGWAHHECGWFTPKHGPTSWFIVGDVSPERARLLDDRRLLHLRGLENTHRVTRHDIGNPLRRIDWGCDW